MRKRDWRRVRHHIPDPGAMIDVPEPRRPDRWAPPDVQKQKATERAERRRELEYRSRVHDLARMLGREAAEELVSIMMDGYRPNS